MLNKVKIKSRPGKARLWNPSPYKTVENFRVMVFYKGSRMSFDYFGDSTPSKDQALEALFDNLFQMDNCSGPEDWDPNDWALYLDSHEGWLKWYETRKKEVEEARNLFGKDLVWFTKHYWR